jgi:predicted metal-dependent hydrolase
MWLPYRRARDGDFYKGLIQLAGAFVHVQKNRPGPAVALLGLARDNLQKYPAVHRNLSIQDVLILIDEWRQRLEKIRTTTEVFNKSKPPQLILLDGKS